MTRKLFAVVAVVLLIAMTTLAGCAAPQDGSTVNSTGDVEDIRKIHFKDDDVVCYVNDDVDEGGLACFTEEELQGQGDSE